MPIRGLDQYSQQGNLQKLPITVFHDTAVAIDGFWYIRKYHPGCVQEDILDFYSQIGKFLDPLCKLAEHVQILWIWDGIEYHKSRPDSEMLSLRLSLRITETISKLESGFAAKNVFDDELYVDPITSYLRSFGITVIRAPYSAVAQCVYFLRENCVKYIFSKSDALLFQDCNKVVVNIFFNTNSIEIIDRNALFALNNLNLESFQRIALLSGCEFCPTIPIYANNFNVADVIKLVASGSIFESLKESFISSNPAGDFEKSEEYSYLSKYARTFVVLIYHPIMALSGRVECLEAQNAPVDLEQLFGKQLSLPVYHEMFNCKLSPISLNEFHRGKSSIRPWKIDVIRECVRQINSLRDISTDEDRAGGAFSPGFLEKILHALKLNVKFSKYFNPITQIIFMKLLGCEFEPTLLIDLINSGYISKNDGRNIVRSISTNTFSFYISVVDYVLVLNDLLFTHSLNYGGNALWRPWHLNYKGLLLEWKKEHIKQFLNENVAANERITECLSLLEK